MKNVSIYRVVKLTEPLSIDSNWDKPQWQAIDELTLSYRMGEAPKFTPLVKVKLMYDCIFLYAVFRVNDKYVRCLNSEINADVWDDSCVEFFFSPDSIAPQKYFNLETNCGGAIVMRYNVIPKKDFIFLRSDDIRQIEIAHSLPKQILHEIEYPVTWTIEYKIPFTLLEKYATITRPAPGVVWKANFYKIADKTSNPHYLTWSFVDSIEPDFHMPAFFGSLIFD